MVGWLALGPVVGFPPGRSSEAFGGFGGFMALIKTRNSRIAFKMALGN